MMSMRQFRRARDAADMNTTSLLAGAALLTTFLLAPVAAQAGTQQDKMKSCAQEYHQQGIAKSQYKTFMAQCLKKDSGSASTAMSGKAAPTAAATPQREKMKTCNAEATSKALKGAARKAYMKSCLKAG